jgi:hypothetical protein
MWLSSQGRRGSSRVCSQSLMRPPGCLLVSGDDDGDGSGGIRRQWVEQAREYCGYPVGENKLIPSVVGKKVVSGWR